MAKSSFSPAAVRDFFAWSDTLDKLVLRPLDHIRSNWEIIWDHSSAKYLFEEDSFVTELNDLIKDLTKIQPPTRYHDNEDRLAQYAIERLKWPISKKGGWWIGEDYDAILEQGGYDDIDQEELLLAAAGRIQAALVRGQTHIDQMEQSHRRMLGAVLSILIYHRADFTK
jgi:hypothetical protein